MTKNVAIFRQSANTESAITELLNALAACGYGLEQPGTSAILGWDTQGDRSVLDSAERAVAFLHDERGGIQLWRSETDDLFVSHLEGHLCLSFDGFTEAAETSLVLALRERNLLFEVADEDEVEYVLASWQDG